MSFLAIAVAAGGCATLIFWRTWLGLIVAGLLLQLAYVIDCVDGQLARVKSMSSPVGALLDFMLDEVKAFMVIASAAARLYLQTPDADDRRDAGCSSASAGSSSPRRASR